MQKHAEKLLDVIERGIMLQKLLESGNEIYVSEKLEALNTRELRFVCMTYDINRLIERREKDDESRDEIHGKLKKKLSEYHSYSNLLKGKLGQERVKSIRKDYPLMRHRDMMIKKLLDSGNERYVIEELEPLDARELKMVCIIYDNNVLVGRYRQGHGSRDEIMSRLQKKHTEYHSYYKLLKENIGQERVESITRNYPVRRSLE